MHAVMHTHMGDLGQGGLGQQCDNPKARAGTTVGVVSYVYSGKVMANIRLSRLRHRTIPSPDVIAKNKYFVIWHAQHLK